MKVLRIIRIIDKGDIKESLDQAVDLCFSRRIAIGTVPSHHSTLRSVREMIPKIKAKGIDIISLSSIVE